MLFPSSRPPLVPLIGMVMGTVPLVEVVLFVLEVLLRPRPRPPPRKRGI